MREGKETSYGNDVLGSRDCWLAFGVCLVFRPSDRQHESSPATIRRGLTLAFAKLRSGFVTPAVPRRGPRIRSHRLQGFLFGIFPHYERSSPSQELGRVYGSHVRPIEGECQM